MTDLEGQLPDYATASQGPDKTIVVHKDEHWWIINSSKGDEKEILRMLLKYAKDEKHTLQEWEALSLIDQLGYKLE